MFCEYCGGKIEEDALFCDICGKPVPSEQHEETVAASENPMSEENQVVALETEQEVKEEIPAAAVQSESQSQADEENVRIQESPVTEEVKPESQAQNQTETFSVKNLFVQVFKKHSAKERSQILKIGMDKADESVYSKKIRSEELHPWFYSRVFVMLAAVLQFLKSAL